ncbi:hypothetical protein HanRHA438_Chr11g0488061 [Helianthus annuus]|nr:hypothetical protein HanRHA438_Chr11g0488061 [Helianthus annuus]
MFGLKIERLVTILAGVIGVNILCICCNCFFLALCPFGSGVCVVWPFAHLGRRCFLMKFSFQKKKKLFIPYFCEPNLV